MIDWQLTETFVFDDRYIRYGVKGSGPALVIVHGTPWSSFNMRHLIEPLSQSFTVYFYDLMGYGQSDKQAGDVSLGIQNQVLDALLDRWQLTNPLIVGHDFGGATVLRTCLLNNRQFEKMVLIDPVALSPWGSPFFKHVKEHEAVFAGVPDYIHEAMVSAYIKTAAFKTLDNEVLKQTMTPWLGDDGRPAFYRQIAQASSKYTDEVEGLYAQITQPVLILWGKEDTWIPLDMGKRLQQKIPDSLLYTIPDSGHLVIEEQPELLVEKIEDFLTPKAVG